VNQWIDWIATKATKTVGSQERQRPNPWW
jgi:hypothetical protein